MKRTLCSRFALLMLGASGTISTGAPSGFRPCSNPRYGPYLGTVRLALEPRLSLPSQSSRGDRRALLGARERR
jgi:hypothetical protein